MTTCWVFLVEVFLYSTLTKSQHSLKVSAEKSESLLGFPGYVTRQALLPEEQGVYPTLDTQALGSAPERRAPQDTWLTKPMG